MLHDLNPTSDQESFPGLQVVRLEKRLPASAPDCRLFHPDSRHDLLVLFLNGNVGDIPAHEPGDGPLRLFRSTVSCQPSAGFRDDEGEDGDRDDEAALKSDGDPPSDRSGDVGETEPDPVGEEDSKVQTTELGSEESTSGGGGSGFSQDDGAGGVDESHSQSRDDSTGNHGSG